jgi:PAS domain S-box-containing protein
VLPDLPRHEQVSEPGYTVNRDEVSTVLTAISAGESELSKQIWDKVLLENTDDVVHVLSLKGLFLYLSPSCRKVLEYDSQELVGTALSSICHPSDIVPVTRELKDTTSGSVSIVFRIRRKHSGYTWFESHGSLHTEQGKGRKYIIMVGRERPVYALSKKDVLANGGIGENELWTKMSTSGMFLFVSYTSKILLDKLPDDLVGTSIQALMRPDSRIELSRALELARTGKRAQFKHELINKRGQVLQAQTTVYPGDASEGQKPTFFVAQTRMLKSTRAVPVSASAKAALKLHQQASGGSTTSGMSGSSPSRFSTQPTSFPASSAYPPPPEMAATVAGNNGLPIGSQDIALASEENVFDELKTTRSTSWQFELRQMEKRNRLLVEELQSLLQSKKKRKRGRGAAQMQKDCANCHTKVTPEWRRGPSGKRDLCNSCGLRWAKQVRETGP